MLLSFSKRYSNNQIIVTCRIAAVDYTFERFTYVEVADFDERQMNIFSQKWFQDENKLALFAKEFNNPKNKGLKELAKTPLLLTLLCLAFDELLVLSERKVELYREAIEALLKKWDASRGIQRDEIYRGLSATRKEHLISRIAARNFFDGKYLLRKENLIQQISDYLMELPKPETKGAPFDGDAVLAAIEAQHGILIQRAYDYYSFSHLSLQEYLTARFIVQNSASGTLEKLIDECIEDDRWYEIALLTSSLLDNADVFINRLMTKLGKLISKDRKTLSVFAWANEKVSISQEKPDVTKVMLITLELFRHYFVSEQAILRIQLKEHPVTYKEELSFLEALIPSIDLCINFLARFDISKAVLSDFHQFRFEITNNENILGYDFLHKIESRTTNYGHG